MNRFLCRNHGSQFLFWGIASPLVSAADCNNMRTSSGPCRRPTGTNDPIRGAIPAASRTEAQSTSAQRTSIICKYSYQSNYNVANKPCRVVHLVGPLGWVDFLFWMFHLLPGSAWALGKLAELAEQVGKMVEHYRSKSTQPNYPTRWNTLYQLWI